MALTFYLQRQMVPVKPAAQHDSLGERPRDAGQIHKNGLNHVFRPMAVAIDQPERRRKNQIDITACQLTKGCFRAALDVFSDQFLGFCHFQPSLKTR